MGVLLCIVESLTSIQYYFQGKLGEVKGYQVCYVRGNNRGSNARSCLFNLFHLRKGVHSCYLFFFDR